MTVSRLAEAVVTIAVIAVFLPIWFLPRPAAIRMARFYGSVVWLSWPLGRRVAMINLRRSLGLGRRQALEMSRLVVCSLLVALAEGVQFARVSRRARLGSRAELDQLFEAEDPELLASLLADPRPKIFVSGHFQSWEVGSSLFTMLFGSRGAVLVRQVDNLFLDRLLRRIRGLGDAQWIEKRGGAREALARLRRGHSIALMLDENAGREGVFVDFFGRPAATHRSAALLALRTGARVVVATTSARKDGRYRLVLQEVDAQPAGRLARDVRRITREITQVLEGWIRRDPTRWRWVHWRWRWRPDGRDECYRRSDLRTAFAANLETVDSRDDRPPRT